MIISLIGPPASGKGTQARMLDFHILSISRKIRETKEKDAAFKEAVDAFELENPGELVPDALFQDRIAGWVSDIKAEHGTDADILIDGYPRTIKQAEHLDTLLQSIDDVLDVVICLDFTPEETGLLVERQMNRGKQAIAKGEKPRADDLDDEVAKRRVDIYWEQTYPAIEKYDAESLAVHVSGSDEVDVVADNIATIIDAARKGILHDNVHSEEHSYVPEPNIWGGLKL